MKTLNSFLTLIALVALFSANAFAQTFPVDATAEVLSAVTEGGEGRSNLEFGNVTQSVSKSIDKTDVSAASWHFNGTANAGVIIDFTLPSSLESGSETLPISFSASDAGWNHDGTIGTQTGFNPNASVDLNTASGNGDLFIWLGGTVAPAANQQAGSYSGQVVLTISYQ